MKHFYSVILLVSLLVGTLQPILPMIEYQLHKGSVIELLSSVEEGTEPDCQMTVCMMEDCENQQTEADQNLLDVDYYPLALDINIIPSPDIFLSSTRFYLPSAKNIIGSAFLPNPPPPRLS